MKTERMVNKIPFVHIYKLKINKLMKLLQLLLLGCCVTLFMQCEEQIIDPNQDPDPNETTLCNDVPMITLFIEYTSISLEFPSCFDINTLQGIDTKVGEIKAVDENVMITYDIGSLAGEYVAENSPNQTTVQGLYEEFRYEIKDNLLLFTFPTAGPANFYTEQLAHEADLVEFFKTLKVD